MHACKGHNYTSVKDKTVALLVIGKIKNFFQLMIKHRKLLSFQQQTSIKIKRLDLNSKKAKFKCRLPFYLELQI